MAFLNVGHGRNQIRRKQNRRRIHEGVCETHANGHKMARQVMRAGYYWLTLESDCNKYARKCHKCQIYADKIHVPLTELHVMALLWPFLNVGHGRNRTNHPKSL